MDPVALAAIPWHGANSQIKLSGWEISQGQGAEPSDKASPKVGNHFFFFFNIFS